MKSVEECILDFCNDLQRNGHQGPSVMAIDGCNWTVVDRHDEQVKTTTLNKGKDVLLLITKYAYDKHHKHLKFQMMALYELAKYVSPAVLLTSPNPLIRELGEKKL